MSCFLHDTKTYDAVYTYLYTHKELSFIWETIHCTPEQYLRIIIDSNVVAYFDRYGKGHEDTRQQAVWKETEFLKNYKPKLTSHEYSPIQIYKFLQSIDYQCIDSQHYCNTHANKTQTVLSAIGDQIIHVLPTYKNALWS